MTDASSPPSDRPSAAAAARAGAGDERRASGRRALLTGIAILCSRLSGLVREVVLAGFLGTRIAADAFKAALQIPGLLQNVLGEGVLSASFVPVYAEELEEAERAASRGEATPSDPAAVAATVGTLLGVVTTLVVALGIVAARPLTWMVLPRAPEETFELTVRLGRVMWAGLGFIVMSAWTLGVLNVHRRFFVSYVAPVLWNLSQVVLAAFAWRQGWSDADVAHAAAWGVAIGGLLQFGVQLPLVRKVAPGLAPMWRTTLAPVREIGRRFGPAVLGRGVVQLSAFLDLFLAGLLASGAIQGLSVAQILYLLPIGVFAMSVVATDLPELSRVRASAPRVAARLRAGHERIVFYVAFCAVAFVVAGKPVVGALFQRGEFTADDTVFVWFVLGSYSLGLVASASSRLFQNACFAAGDVSGPARIAGLRVAIAAAIGALLMLQADRFGVVDGSVQRLGDLPAFSLLPDTIREDDTGPQRLGAVGLALGSAVAAWVEFVILRRRVRRGLVTTRLARDPMVVLAAPMAAAAVVGAAVAVAADALPPLVGAPLVVGLSGVAYVAVAYSAGSPSAAALLRTTRIVR